MISKEHKIESKKTARFFTLGNLSKSNSILIALHGYGQLPEYFARKFQKLSENGVFLVFPEGFHRFYLNGTSGRVGASWMTKEDRLSDIKDNISYLQQVLEIHLSMNLPISILGFSQGGTTMIRFVDSVGYKFEKLIMWASSFPDEVTRSQFITNEYANKNYFVLGKQDEYFDEASQEKVCEMVNQLGFEFISFDGTHDIYQDVLLKIFN